MSSSSERKAYLRILTSLAWADGEIEHDELEVVHLAASELSVALSERDLEERDLEELATKVTDVALQGRLLDEMAKLAMADGHAGDEELGEIKALAQLWQLSPPQIEGLDWRAVSSRFESGE